MFKVSRNFSTLLSLTISVIFFLCCIVGMFILPFLIEFLLTFPAGMFGSRDSLSQLERILIYIASYGIIACFILADILLFFLLLRVRRGLVFTDRTVSLIRGVSWCCFGLCIPFGFLGIYFQLSLLVCIFAFFLGTCLRVCKNAFEEATQIKQENDLTV